MADAVPYNFFSSGFVMTGCMAARAGHDKIS
jgi:hypothetical protein